MSGDPQPFGLDPASLRIFVILELLFAVAHQALAASLLFILGPLGDARAAWAGLAMMFALSLAAVVLLASRHPRASLVLASVPTVACLLLDAYLFAGGPGRG